MTEVVQKRLELMTEELEEMQRIKLFTAEDIKKIIAQRKEHEYKIHAITKDLNSFTNYIAFEKLLLKDIRLRRNKYKIGEKKSSIEHQIIKRVKLLYEIALQRFSNIMPLFLEYLSFCKRLNYVNAACEVVSNMIKLHPNDPQIWHIAANWHAYDRQDTNTAMIMLLKGVAIHKDNQILYKEMVKIELVDVERIPVEESAQHKEICINKLKKTLASIFENVKDANFYIELLELLEKYAFTVQIQELIAEHMITNFSNDENVWNVLAQRERKDIPNSCNIKTTANTEADEAESTRLAASKKKTPKARLEACFAKYRQGLASISPSNKPKLWTLYLEFLFKLQRESHGAGTVLKLETLKAALNEVALEGHLSEHHYMSWLELVDDKEGLEIAKRGTDALPQSVELWKARLHLQMMKDVEAEVDQVFKLGIIALKEKSLPLWDAILKYHYLTSDNSFIELIYKDAVKQVPEISDSIKPQYLGWLVLTNGIESAREEYNKFAEQKPYCKNIHVMMSKLESQQINFNYEAWGKVHRLACEQFGNEDVDVWINYIQFYLHYNKNVQDLNERIQCIRKEALNSIPKELHSVFESKYTIIQESA